MSSCVKTRVEFELEELKRRLGNGEILNLDNVTNEINRIADTIKKIEIAGVLAIDSKDLNLDDSTINFWHGFHQQLDECGFGFGSVNVKQLFSFIPDVQIICNDGSLKVHRVVLISASDFFRDIFKKTAEENPVVHLEDWPVNEVRPVIDLLYRGQVLIPSTSTKSIFEILDSLKIHSPQINLSRATAKDLSPVNEFPSNVTGKSSIHGNQIKLSALRTLNNLTPFEVLNDMCPKLEFLYENRTGLDEEVGFVVKTFFELTNKTYSARESCKKAAKHKCAAEILNDLGIQVKYQSSAQDDAAQLISNIKSEIDASNGNGIKKPQTESNGQPSVENRRKSKINPEAVSSIPLKSSATLQTLNGINIDNSILRRIINIRNLEENAWTALCNLNGSQSTPFEILENKCPPLSSNFTCRVPFKNSWFSGTGVSEKQAKSKAAFQALSAILGPEKLEELCERSKSRELILKNQLKSVKTSVPNQSTNLLPSSLSASLASLHYNWEDLGVDRKILDRVKYISNLEKNLDVAIYNLSYSSAPPQYKFQPLESPNPNLKGSDNFVCKLWFRKREFIGYGERQTEAEENAQRKGLMSVLGVKAYEILFERSKRLEVPKQQGRTEPKPEAVTQTLKANGFFESVILKSASLSSSLSSTSVSISSRVEEGEKFSDFVHNLITKKYGKMMNQDPEHSHGKVLAGVVMTTRIPLRETAQIIAVATGSNFIQGKSLSLTGEAVHDCHAEILVTRCLRDFFYQQIVSFIRGNDSIFTSDFQFQSKSQDDETRRKGLRLKEDVEFHLYISTAPCGDARCFVDPGSESVVDSNPSRGNRGLLRTKLEASEGTIPATKYPYPSFRQSWSELMGGERLRIMSCSDKICRWNILGVQGALLSYLIDPVYYSSIILGSHHHSEHFQRAVFGRIADPERIIRVPSKYKVNKPDLVTISSTCTATAIEKKAKGPNYAVLWCFYWNKYEILSTRTGRIQYETTMTPSRVSKQNAFSRFLNILKLRNGFSTTFTKCSYQEAKLHAKEYQEIKTKFHELMQETNLGSWIRKPEQVDGFFIEDSS